MIWKKVTGPPGFATLYIACEGIISLCMTRECITDLHVAMLIPAFAGHAYFLENICRSAKPCEHGPPVLKGSILQGYPPDDNCRCVPYYVG